MTEQQTGVMLSFGLAVLFALWRIWSALDSIAASMERAKASEQAPRYRDDDDDESEAWKRGGN